MRVLVIGAHPDDETMLAGAMVTSLAAAGHEVILLCVTRGEGGEVGNPPLAPPEGVAELREAEQRCAAQALGIREVRFLGYVDPHAEPGGELHRIAASPQEFAAAIAGQLEDLRPDLVLTHGSDGDYGHPQHIFTHEATFEALKLVQPWQPGEVLTWCANSGTNAEDRITNQSDPADIVLEVAPWFSAKLAAAECHRSQHDMILRNNKVQQIGQVLARRQSEAYRRWPRQTPSAEEKA